MPNPIPYEEALRAMKVERKRVDGHYRTRHSTSRQLRAPEREKLGALVISYLSQIAEMREDPTYGIEFVLDTVAGPLVIHYAVGWGAIFQQFTDESKYGLLGHGLANQVNRRTGKWNFHHDKSNTAAYAFVEWKTEIEELLRCSTI